MDQALKMITLPRVSSVTYLRHMVVCSIAWSINCIWCCHVSGTKGDYCEIASQPIKPLNSDTYTDDHCLKFWYRFENSSLVKLQVMLSNETTSSREVIDLLWTSTSQLPSKMWHLGKTHFRLDRHETQSKRIWIKATNLGKYRQGYIELYIFICL